MAASGAGDGERGIRLRSAAALAQEEARQEGDDGGGWRGRRNLCNRGALFHQVQHDEETIALRQSVWSAAAGEIGPETSSSGPNERTATGTGPGRARAGRGSGLGGGRCHAPGPGREGGVQIGGWRLREVIPA
jgi:hypothetical protein